MHAGVALALRVTYDPYYCRHFATQLSSWSSTSRMKPARPGPRLVPESRTIRLPAALGPHTVAP